MRASRAEPMGDESCSVSDDSSLFQAGPHDTSGVKAARCLRNQAPRCNAQVQRHVMLYVPDRDRHHSTSTRILTFVALSS